MKVVGPLHFQFFRAPVSSNHAQWSKRFRKKGKPNNFVIRRINTTDTRKYMDYIHEIDDKSVTRIPEGMLQEIKDCNFFATRYMFTDRFMQKKNTSEPLKKDVTNLLKTTEDAVMKALGQNDKKVWDTLLHKEHTDNDFDARFILSIWGFTEMPVAGHAMYRLCSDMPMSAKMPVLIRP